jgi:hypothetical protein
MQTCLKICITSIDPSSRNLSSKHFPNKDNSGADRLVDGCGVGAAKQAIDKLSQEGFVTLLAYRGRATSY